jgi:hypothetical protein
MTWRDWVDALLSGNYKQTQKHLRDSNGFCCLGVACDVYDPTKWVQYTPYYAYMIDDFEKVASLPTEIRNYLKIDLDFQGELIEMNDSGASFAEIAQVITKQFENNESKDNHITP